MSSFSTQFHSQSRSQFLISSVKAAAFALVVAASSLFFSGCASVQPVNGILYSDVAGPVAVSSTPLGPKHGTSCASSILNLIATGDASITTAAKQAGIGQVSHVEQHSTSIWFLYTKYCVDVWGWAPRGGTTTAPTTTTPPAAKAPGASLTPLNGSVQTADIKE